MDMRSTVNTFLSQKVYNRLKTHQNRCLLCLCTTDRHQLLCQPCHNDLPYNHLKCTICSKNLLSSGICSECSRKPNGSRTHTEAIFIYDYPIDQLLIGFKFHDKLLAGRLLARLMAEYLQTHTIQDARPEAIMAMPLHRKRLRQRGFNQAYELARPVSKRLNIPIMDCARRIKDTLHQTELSASKRRANVRRAFAVESSLNGRHIAVIDDVITTGSTVDEFARSLKRAGAARVDVWALAIRPLT